MNKCPRKSPKWIDNSKLFQIISILESLNRKCQLQKVVIARTEGRMKHKGEGVHKYNGITITSCLTFKIDIHSKLHCVWVTGTSQRLPEMKVWNRIQLVIGRNLSERFMNWTILYGNDGVAILCIYPYSFVSQYFWDSQSRSNLGEKFSWEKNCLSFLDKGTHAFGRHLERIFQLEGKCIWI